MFEAVVLGSNPSMVMAKVDEIIHFLQPLADEFCMIQRAVPSRLNMQGAYVFRPDSRHDAMMMAIHCKR